MNQELKELQSLYQKKFQDSIEIIDKDFLRRMQSDQYLCSAKCCQDLSMTSEDVQNCLSKCNKPVLNAQGFIENEINAFQNRLQRCMMDCADKQKDRMSATPSEKELKDAEMEVSKCARICVNSHLDNNLPGLMTRIKDRFRNQAF